MKPRALVTDPAGGGVSITTAGCRRRRGAGPSEAPPPARRGATRRGPQRGKDARAHEQMFTRQRRRDGRRPGVLHPRGVRRRRRDEDSGRRRPRLARRRPFALAFVLAELVNFKKVMSRKAPVNLADARVRVDSAGSLSGRGWQRATRRTPLIIRPPSATSMALSPIGGGMEPSFQAEAKGGGSSAS